MRGSYLARGGVASNEEEGQPTMAGSWPVPPRGRVPGERTGQGEHYSLDVRTVIARLLGIERLCANLAEVSFAMMIAE